MATFRGGSGRRRAGGLGLADASTGPGLPRIHGPVDPTPGPVSPPRPDLADRPPRARPHPTGTPRSPACAIPADSGPAGVLAPGISRPGSIPPCRGPDRGPDRRERPVAAGPRPWPRPRQTTPAVCPMSRRSPHPPFRETTARAAAGSVPRHGRPRGRRRRRGGRSPPGSSGPRGCCRPLRPAGKLALPTELRAFIVADAARDGAVVGTCVRRPTRRFVPRAAVARG